MASACALLADVVPVSSHKSAFKIRTKIQPNLIFLYINILAACSWSIVFPEIRTYYCKSMLEKSGLYMECIRIVIDCNIGI